VIVAFHGWLVGSDTSEGQVVPFYLQPSIGGHTTLRSFADYRFHDRNLFVLAAEARVSMMTHVDAADSSMPEMSPLASGISTSTSGQSAPGSASIRAVRRLPASTWRTAPKGGGSFFD
jgi:hypothetical protein